MVPCQPIQIYPLLLRETGIMFHLPMRKNCHAERIAKLDAVHFWFLLFGKKIGSLLIDALRLHGIVRTCQNRRS